MNDLIVLEEKELSGIEPSKAAQIKATFEPMVKMLESFEDAFNEVTAKEINAETCAEAKRLRLDIAKIRIEADKVRKAQKEEYLRAGNAIQGVFNILKFAVTDKEEKLRDIELFEERREAERVAKLQEERVAELEKYDFDGSALELGKMADEVWTNFLNGTRLNYEAVKEAERKAEEDRIAREEAERAEQERIRAENEKLRKEAEKREKAAAAEREKAQEERRKQEAALQAEREKAQEERRKQEAALQAEREQRERIEREAREREEARQKAEAEKKRLEAEEAKRRESAPDLERLNEIYNYLKEQYRLAKGTEAKNGIAEAGKIITATIESLK